MDKKTTPMNIYIYRGDALTAHRIPAYQLGRLTRCTARHMAATDQLACGEAIPLGTSERELLMHLEHAWAERRLSDLPCSISSGHGKAKSCIHGTHSSSSTPKSTAWLTWLAEIAEEMAGTGRSPTGSLRPSGLGIIGRGISRRSPWLI